MTELYQSVTECRGCGANLGDAILDYGRIPIADALAEHANEHTHQAPLSLHQCAECSLLQLGTSLNPSAIYNNAYPYFSSAIESLVTRMQTQAEQVIAQLGLNEKSQVIEIASNDGYCLQHFAEHGIPVLGIEPCAPHAALAEQRGITTQQEFFTQSLASRIVEDRGAADLVIANNVIAHVSDPNDFIAGVATLLKPNGTAIFEFHSALAMLATCQFDTLYHQHHCYFTLSTFQRLLAQHQLNVVSVQTISAYGGSLRVRVSSIGEADQSVASQLHKESKLHSLIPLFVEAATQRIHQLQDCLRSLYQQNKTIIGYGAAAKASTLLAVCNVADCLQYVVDINQYKHGRYLPSTSLEIRAVESLHSTPPDYILVLAWNYADEIMTQLRGLQEQGTKMIVPLPELRLV